MSMIPVIQRTDAVGAVAVGNYLHVLMVLIVAGLFEVGWAVGLKAADGFSRPVHSMVYVSMILSVMLLGLTMKALPVGTAYALWTGIGTIGTTLLGPYLFGEMLTYPRIACIVLIFIGICGLGYIDWIEGQASINDHVSR